MQSRALSSSGEAAAVSPSLEALFEAHAKDVVRWAQRLGGSQVDPEDVLQEVFVVVQRKLPRWRPGRGSLQTWLYRICENVVRHQRRRDRFRRWLGAVPEGTLEAVAAPGMDPARALEQRRAHARFYEALDGLPEKHRNALVLFELEGYSGEQIAELMGVKTATVWVWLHRARAQFLKRLEALEGKR